jgi:hypothetical protein
MMKMKTGRILNEIQVLTHSKTKNTNTCTSTTCKGTEQDNHPKNTGRGSCDTETVRVDIRKTQAQSYAKDARCKPNMEEKDKSLSPRNRKMTKVPNVAKRSEYDPP